jgi:hypothetical protein
MDQHNYVIMQWPDGTTEKQKEWIMAIVKEATNKKTRICVVYYPDCGCEVSFDYQLDRYPMSSKIHAQCPVCHKWGLAEISDPIKFYLPLIDTSSSLDDLRKMVIMDGPQKPWLEAYQCEATMQFLEKACDENLKDEPEKKKSKKKKSKKTMKKGLK